MQLDTSVPLLYNGAMITEDRAIKSRLAELRKAKGLTQDELAEAIGVQQHSISNMEKNKHGISDSTKAKICAALDCNIGDLLYIDTPSKK
jgi:DNA-binding Xre family transcriptional regulator